MNPFHWNNPPFHWDNPFNETLSVIEYGATGDGTTDDTAAISAALNAATAAGGGIVVIPDGTYLISKTLRINSHTRLDVSQNALLYQADNTDGALLVNNDCPNALTAAQVVVTGGTATVTEPAHNRTVGDIVYIYNSQGNLTINGKQTILTVSGNDWTFADAGTNPTNPATDRIYVSGYNSVAAMTFTRASNVVTVVEAGHIRQTGDKVWIDGLTGATNPFDGIAEITSTDHDAGEWTYSNTGANEAATGMATAQILGNTGIEFRGLRYDGNAANQNNDLFQGFQFMLCNIGNSLIDLPLARNYVWRGINMYNANNIIIPRAHFENGHVGMQYDSGVDGVEVGMVTGHNMTDDLVAWGVVNRSGTFGATGSPAGVADMGTLKVSRIHGQSDTGLLKLYCYTGFDLGSVLVGSITGNGKGIASGASADTTGGSITQLVVDHFDAAPNAAGDTGISLSGIDYGYVHFKHAEDNYTSTATTLFCGISGTVTKLQFDNLLSLNYHTSYPVIQHDNGADVGELILNNCTVSAGSGGEVINFASGGSADLVTLNGVEFRGGGAPASGDYFGDLLTVANGGTCSSIAAINISLTTGQNAGVFKFGDTGGQTDVVLNGITMLTAGRSTQLFTDASTTHSANVYFSNIYLETTIVNHIFQIAGTSTWNIKGSGVNAAAGQFVLITGGPTPTTFSIDCKDCKEDLTAGASNFAPNAGDVVWNTQAGFGTGIGLYGYTNAGAWAQLF